MSSSETAIAPPSGGAERTAGPEQRIGAAVESAALGTPGVHVLGGPVTRSLTRASRAVLGATTAPGVGVAIVGDETIVDLDVVVAYPHPVHEVADAVRRNAAVAASAVIAGAGTVVVHVVVGDVHGPSDLADAPEGHEDEPLAGPPAPSTATTVDESSTERTPIDRTDPVVAERIDVALDTAVSAESKADEALRIAAVAEAAVGRPDRPTR